MNEHIFTSNQNPCIPTNMIAEQPATDPGIDLEAIGAELGSMEKDVFFNVVISRSADLAEEKSSRPESCKESEPAAPSDRIALQQDDFITYAQ